MKKLITISLLSLFLATPLFSFAATPAGLTPKSPFYFLDTLFERINLALTFNPEKKATKALLFAEERLAEASTNAEEEKLEVIEALMTNYQANVSLATEKSKEVKDEKKAEELLNKIVDNTAKHQEILTEVLNKVPEVAKEAIEKALETSKKGQEEALKQISELKKEVEVLKQEVVELKKQLKTTPSTDTKTSIKELKEEIEELKKQTNTPVSILQPEVKIEEQMLILSNSYGISYPIDNPAINRQRVQDLIDVGFFVTQGKLPEGIVIKSASGASAIPATPATPAPKPELDTTPPIISNIRTNNITKTSAIITWTTDENSDSKVSLATIQVANVDKVTSHSIILNNLIANTTYSYRIISTDASGNIATSSEQSFTTLAIPPPPDTIPPVISGIQTKDITDTSVTITWATNELTDSQVEYGLTTSYGQTTELNTLLTASHSVSLLNLQAGTLYYFKIKSKDGSSNLTISVTSDASERHTFRTIVPPDSTPPKITNIEVQDIKTRTAKLVWKTEVLSKEALNVNYGTEHDLVYSANSDLSSPLHDTTFGQNYFATWHTPTLTNLQPGTTYYYRIIVKDWAGNKSQSEISTFKTLTIGSLTVSSIPFTDPIQTVCTTNSNTDVEIFKIRLTASSDELLNINLIRLGIPEMPFYTLHLFVDGVKIGENETNSSKDIQLQTGHNRTIRLYTDKYNSTYTGLIIPAGASKDLVFKVASIPCSLNWKDPISLSLLSSYEGITGNDWSSSWTWSGNYSDFRKYLIEATGITTGEKIYVPALGPLKGPVWTPVYLRDPQGGSDPVLGWTVLSE